MDAAVLVVAADQPCPCPQTLEHLSAVDLLGLRNILVVQNKVDLNPREKLVENYREICKFTDNTVASESPIIPVCAQKGWNVDSLLRHVAELDVPDRNTALPPLMMVVRSFDVNKPGEEKIDNLQGAVGMLLSVVFFLRLVGGSLVRGCLQVGQTVEMRPGRLEPTGKDGLYRMKPIRTKVLSMFSEKNELSVALTGGLIALGTTLDPSLGKADRLVGQTIGLPGMMPNVYQKIIVSHVLVERVIEDLSQRKNAGDFYGKSKSFFQKKEVVKLNIGSQATTATVKGAKSDLLKLFLTVPCCAELKTRISISVKNSSGRWVLAGMGMLLKGAPLEEIADPS